MEKAPTAPPDRDARPAPPDRDARTAPPDRETDANRNYSGQRKSRAPDGVITDLARRQHLVFSREHMLEGGFDGDAIDYRLQIGRLHLVHRTVYSVVHPSQLTRHGRWMAAVLAAGPGAVLSHRSAAALWGLRPQTAGPIDITVSRQRRTRRGIRFHLHRLASDEVTTTDGIPTTTVPRTLLDQATVGDTRQVERALNEADVLHLWDKLSLDDLLARYPGRRGARGGRAALERRRQGATATRSELEERFIRVVDRIGFRRPEVGVWLEVGGRRFEVDCLWRPERLAVELDGRRFHARVAAFETDRERDRILQAHSWRPVRITPRQLKESENEVFEDLSALLSSTP